MGYSLKLSELRGIRTSAAPGVEHACATKIEAINNFNQAANQPTNLLISHPNNQPINPSTSQSTNLQIIQLSKMSWLIIFLFYLDNCS